MRFAARPAAPRSATSSCARLVDDADRPDRAAPDALAGAARAPPRARTTPRPRQRLVPVSRPACRSSALATRQSTRLEMAIGRSRPCRTAETLAALVAKLDALEQRQRRARRASAAARRAHGGARRARHAVRAQPAAGCGADRARRARSRAVPRRRGRCPPRHRAGAVAATRSPRSHVPVAAARRAMEPPPPDDAEHDSRAPRGARIRAPRISGADGRSTQRNALEQRVRAEAKGRTARARVQAAPSTPKLPRDPRSSARRRRRALRRGST